MYFDKFPYTNYEFPDGKIRFFKNLTIRPSVVREVYGNLANLQEYIIKEGETPETIAFDVYGSAEMHWVVMLSNEVYNVYTDWPMTTTQFDKHLRDKYRVQHDSEGVEVVLDDVEVQELLEFTGAPSNNYSSFTASNRVEIRPHHFVDDDGEIYSYHTATATNNIDAFGRTVTLPSLYPVSIYDWEADLNEKKRVIFLPKKSIANQMRAELSKVINV